MQDTQCRWNCDIWKTMTAKMERKGMRRLCRMLVEESSGKEPQLEQYRSWENSTAMCRRRINRMGCKWVSRSCPMTDFSITDFEPSELYVKRKERY